MRQTILFFALLATVLSAPYEEWRGKVIYQVLTDRFSQTVFTTNQCDNLSDYCGGTFQGMINNISYIQGMGFDAIWISPVPENYPEGYHGYWATNWYEINSNFGNSDDLHNLVDTMHNNNMWAMLDVVANHVGPVGFEFSEVNPFSNDSNYHTYCEITDYSNQEQCLFCRLDDLPDLAQEDNTTGTLLLNWVNNIVSTYNFDGLRVDTVPYVPIWFWEQYKQSAGVYTVGEVFNGLISFGAQFQGTAMDGILNYPMFFTIRSVFQSGQSMNNIQSYYQGASAWPDQTILGIFVDNHDNPRFLYGNPSVQMFQAALGFSLSVVGIPIIYYGDEQNYNGGPGSACREVLWTNMNPNAPTYQMIAQINAYRSQTQYWNQPQVQRWSDDTFYAFTRGQYFFAFTNGQASQTRTITYQPYNNGQVLCNLFASSDCVTVSGGSFPVTLNNGEFKFYYPQGSYNPEL